MSDEKVVRYMGATVARVVKGFCAHVRAEAARAVDYNAFAERLVMYI